MHAPLDAAPDAITPATPRRHTVSVPALDRQIDCGEDETLFAAARRNGLRIVGACGGRGTCGSCIVRVHEGRVHREREGAHKQWLRACCVHPRSDLTLEVAPRSLAPVVRADVRSGGEGIALACRPLVAAQELQLEPATLQDGSSDVDRVRRALERQGRPRPIAVDRGAAAELPALLREHGWRVSLRTSTPADAARIIGFARPGAPLLGLAVDLGTTNAAAFLVDLQSGRPLASLGLENPQVAWGADLISRLEHAIKEPGAAEALRQAAVNAINALAHDLARAVDARAGDIADVVVCGNTAMQHLLAGWPVSQLARAPFVSAMNEALDVPARDLGLKLAAGANLHLVGGVGGFVGGDHVSALLATEPLWSQPGVSLVMDIGTNTEISLVQVDGTDGADPARIWSTSCPSGPALEGGHVASGMRAAEGAIERVALVDGGLRLQVIGGGAPIGLCGSGVLDALAAFVQAGWVDARGRIVGGSATSGQIGKVDGVMAITLAEESAEVPAVRFTQHDVRAVQLAKSAIRTGVELLAAEAGPDASRIDRFIIAGAFGAYISVESCIAIGLLPALPRARFKQVGNAAGLGVQQMLASTERRARAARLALECRCVGLSSRSDFQKTFLRHIGFASP
ncbi:MAG: DUF4445 domain-containing protein [Burkholderiales bacterium]|nr:DUF4445 domain-containing protein [Burkholderiales bacterium]